MFGLTNAQGVTWPDFQTELNGYNHTLWENLREELLPRTVAAISANNPAVGSLVYFAGKEWIVVHLEEHSGDNGLLYLTTKGIWGSSDGGGFYDSVGSFEATMIANFRHVGSILQDISAMPMITSNDARYVFIPTLEQVSQEFALFRNGQYANCAAGWVDTGELVPWRLASGAVVDGNQVDFVVEADGFYSGNLSDRAYRNATQSVGFRPFVCMKMR